MIYFDTDILIHAIIEQDELKHIQSKRVFYECLDFKTISISLLSVQEVAFVLGKLKTPVSVIRDKVNDFLALKPHNLASYHYQRAVELAYTIDFQNFNDCLHTAIAESYCTELYTFNKTDFEKIKPLTSLKVTVF